MVAAQSYDLPVVDSSLCVHERALAGAVAGGPECLFVCRRGVWTPLLDRSCLASAWSHERRLSVVRSGQVIRSLHCHVHGTERGGFCILTGSCEEEESALPETQLAVVGDQQAFRRPNFKPLDHHGPVGRDHALSQQVCKYWRLGRSVIAPVRLMTVVWSAQIWTFQINRPLLGLNLVSQHLPADE